MRPPLNQKSLGLGTLRLVDRLFIAQLYPGRMSEQEIRRSYEQEERQMNNPSKRVLFDSGIRGVFAS